MRSTHPFFRFLLILTTLLLSVRVSFAQEERPTPRRAFLEGTHAFRRLLGDYGLKPLKSLQELKENRERSLLIVLGDLEVLDDLDEKKEMTLSTFFWSGGAALIASDKRLKSDAVAAELRVRIGGRYVAVGQSATYRELHDCPLLYRNPFNSGADSLTTRLFSRLETVALNNPSYLEQGPPQRVLPPFAAPESTALRVVGIIPGTQLPGGTAAIAVGGTIQKQGRVLIIADHSLFINEMMMQRDNDNVYFALNAIDWLTENGKRDRVLFIENGQIKESFEVPLEEPQLPPLPSLDYLVPLMNKAMLGMQDENLFADLFNQILPANRLLRILAVGATLFLVIYLMLQLGSARKRVDTREPVLAQVLAQQPQPGLALEQRNLSMLADGNLYDAARQLARQEVVRVFGRPLPPIDQELPAGIMTPPSLVVQGPWWQRWRWQRRWRTLWTLALGATPIRMSPRRFQQLSQELKELRTAADADRIYVDQPSS